jgi:hypothetical protein
MNHRDNPSFFRNFNYGKPYSPFKTNRITWN